MYFDRFIFSAAIDPNEVEPIISYSKQAPWPPADVTQETGPGQVRLRTTHYDLNESEERGKILALKLEQLIQPYINIYMKNLRIFQVGERGPFSFLKYNETQNEDFHVDGIGHGASKRLLSVIFYLNDDFEGGEIEFPFQNLTITPKSGLLLIFPSNFCYAHQVKPVVKGTKYSLVTWYYGRVE